MRPFLAGASTDFVPMLRRAASLEKGGTAKAWFWPTTMCTHRGRVPIKGRHTPQPCGIRRHFCAQEAGIWYTAAFPRAAREWIGARPIL